MYAWHEDFSRLRDERPERARRLDGSGIRPVESDADAIASGWLPVSIPEPPPGPGTKNLAVVDQDGQPVGQWTVTPPPQSVQDEQADRGRRRQIEQAIKDAMGDLDQVIGATTNYINDPSPGQGQTVAHVKVLSRAVRVLAQNQRRLIRLAARDLSGTG